MSCIITQETTRGELIKTRLPFARGRGYRTKFTARTHDDDRGLATWRQAAPRSAPPAW